MSVFRIEGRFHVLGEKYIMTKVQRRIIIASVGIVFTGLIIVWCLYFPYSNGDDLRRAIPSNAVFVSQHDRLADRYIPFLSNRLTRTAMTSFGIKDKDLNDIIKDSGSSRLIRMFASKTTFLAYVPIYSNSGKGAWVLSSWAGGWGQLLRWGVLSSLLKDFKEERTDRGLKCWVLKGSDPDAPRLALTSVRGVLLGCYAKDTTILQHMVNLIELSVPLYDHDLDRQPATAVYADRGYYKWMGQVDGEIKMDQVKFAADIGAESLNVDVSGRTWLNGNLKLANYPELSTITNVLPIMPDSIAVFPYRYYDDMLNSKSISRQMRVTCRILGSAVDTNSPMFLAVYGGALNGRLLGVKVPTIVAGVRAHDMFTLTNWIPGTLDGINMYLKTALIASPLQGEGYEMLSIDSSRQDVYSSMKENERPALALKDGWLLFCSNRQSLESLLKCPASDTGNFDVVGNGGSSISAYLDLNKSSDSLKNIIAVILLVQMSQGMTGDGNASEYMRQAMSMLKGLAPLGDCRVSLEIHDGAYNLHVRAGKR